MQEKRMKGERGITKIILLIFVIISAFIITILGINNIFVKSNSEDYVENKNTSKKIENSENTNKSLERSLIIDGFKFIVPEDLNGRLDEKMIILENEELTVRIGLKISNKSYEECMENPESLTQPLTKSGYRITKDLTEITMNGIKCAYCTGATNEENILIVYAKGNKSKKIAAQAIVEKKYEKNALDIFTRIVASASETTASNSTIENSEVISNSSKNKKNTAIEYNVTYTKDISSSVQAINEIKEEAERQRQNYNNSKIKEIETEMEEKYGIVAVNLGEMDVETANAIEEAFNYTYKYFPKLKGTLSNVTLGNLTNLENDAVALIDDVIFITPQKTAEYPRVMKHEMLLSAREFLNPTRMQNTIDFCIGNGKWSKDSNVQSIIAHELCHTIIDIIKVNRYGIEDMFYITQSNSENYRKYLLEDYADNQTTAKEIVTQAYERSGKQVTFDEFLNSISGYAAVKSNKSGIYRYEETCAEAYADYYLHGENCSKASRLVLEELIKCYNKYCK